MSARPEPVVVVGGGWSGLAAAIELCRHGVPVTVIEAGRQLGGRARCVRFGDLRVDNGQHLVIGAYHALLDLLATVGVEEDTVFLRRPLDLCLRSASGPGLRLRTAALPAPLHLLAGLLGARGLSLRERGQALRFGRGLLAGGVELPEDISVQALLIGARQSARLIRYLWEPLCLAILNTPLPVASARMFLAVLREAFTGQRRNGDLLIPRTDLGGTLPAPALDFIERHQGKVVLGARVRGLEIGSRGIRGVRLADGGVAARRVVLAVNPTMCRRLLAPHDPLHDLAADLARLGDEPITTVYLRYPDAVAMEQEMVGILDGTLQWVFDRRVCGQPGLMAGVISGGGDHLALDGATLAARAAAELAALHPHWPPPVDTLVIRERRATFAATVGVDALRPAHRTPVPGLWLAGDFTATGLPATLEGAVRAGLACARGLLAQDAATAAGEPA